jgi:hypothetical protein
MVATCPAWHVSGYSAVSVRCLPVATARRRRLREPGGPAAGPTAGAGRLQAAEVVAWRRRCRAMPGRAGVPSRALIASKAISGGVAGEYCPP